MSAIRFVGASPLARSWWNPASGTVTILQCRFRKTKQHTRTIGLIKQSNAHCKESMVPWTWRWREETRVGNGPGQFLGSYVLNRVITVRLVQWLGWVFATQERKKERGWSHMRRNLILWRSQVGQYVRPAQSSQYICIWTPRMHLERISKIPRASKEV